jgi:hypothetical protein
MLPRRFFGRIRFPILVQPVLGEPVYQTAKATACFLGIVPLGDIDHNVYIHWYHRIHQHRS